MPQYAEKGRTALDESEGGAFKRKESTYRDFVKKGGEYPPEGASWVSPPLQAVSGNQLTRVPTDRATQTMLRCCSGQVPLVHLLCVSLGQPLPGSDLLEGPLCTALWTVPYSAPPLPSHRCVTESTRLQSRRAFPAIADM